LLSGHFAEGIIIDIKETPQVFFALAPPFSKYALIKNKNSLSSFDTHNTYCWSCYEPSTALFTFKEGTWYLVEEILSKT